MNTGAEGVETALKLARKWGYKKKKIPKDEVRSQDFLCTNLDRGLQILNVSLYSILVGKILHISLHCSSDLIAVKCTWVL